MRRATDCTKKYIERTSLRFRLEFRGANIADVRPKSMSIFSFYPDRRTRIAPVLLSIALVSIFFISSEALSQDEDGDPADEAIALFNRGQDAHEKGDLKLAIELYEKALKIIPNFPEAEVQRGNAYQSLGKLDEAEKAFLKAVDLRDDWSLALANLGSVLVHRGRFADAEKHLSKAIEIDDLNFPAYAAMTELRLKTKAPPEVLNALLVKVRGLTAKANPTASIWASRAALERATGDRKAAKSSLAKALELDPGNVFALSESAALALLESDPSAADGFVKRLEAAAPQTETTRSLRARVLFAQGKASDALSLIGSISDPSADTVELKNQIVTSSTADTTELEKQLAASPKSASILSRLCIAFRTRDPLRALDYCKRASEASPESIQPVIGYAAALVQAKQYGDAVVVLRKLIAVAPDNSTARANLATALFQLGRFSDAKVEFRWLTENQPDQPIAYYFLGIVHDRLEEFADAAANYQQFLRLADPESSKLEIEKVNLRLPAVLNLVKEGKGKRRG